MTLGEFSIATWHWDKSKGSVSVKYGSGADNNEIRADGQDDARLTFRGRKVCKIEIKLTWKADKDDAGGPGPVDAFARNMLADISPRGLKAGKPQAWVEDSQRIHNVNNITIDDMDTEYPPSTGIGTATLKCSSWVKPRAQPPVTATPNTPDPWAPGEATQAPRAPEPGFSNTPVTVTP